MRLTGNFQLKGSILISFFLMYFVVTSSGQNKTLEDQEDLKRYIDQIYGSDDLLINGPIYVPQHGLAAGHPYFEIVDWVYGSLFIKGHIYDDVKLKYNIELDEFILFIKDRQDRKKYIVLNHHFIDSVYMGKYVFVNTDVLPEVEKDLGYAELVYDRNFIFLIKYTRDFKTEYSDSKPYGEYTEQKATHYICESGKLVKISGKKAFLAYFESEKKEIKKYLKKNNIKYKKANSGELYNLLNYCNAIRNK